MKTAEEMARIIRDEEAFLRGLLEEFDPNKTARGRDVRLMHDEVVELMEELGIGPANEVPVADRIIPCKVVSK